MTRFLVVVFFALSAATSLRAERFPSHLEKGFSSVVRARPSEPTSPNELFWYRFKRTDEIVRTTRFLTELRDSFTPAEASRIQDLAKALNTAMKSYERERNLPSGPLQKERQERHDRLWNEIRDLVAQMDTLYRNVATRAGYTVREVQSHLEVKKGNERIGIFDIDSSNGGFMTLPLSIETRVFTNQDLARLYPRLAPDRVPLFEYTGLLSWRPGSDAIRMEGTGDEEVTAYLDLLARLQGPAQVLVAPAHRPPSVTPRFRGGSEGHGRIGAGT